VRASWVVTGETASYKGVAPSHPFDPFNISAGNWGALEVAARGSQQHINADAFTLGFATLARSARVATEWALGANWYLNRNVFLALDFARTTFDGGKQGGDRTPEEVFISRVQFLL
jgi:phosphate-selective porin OprO/OprP